jgi:outer membrane receptor for ferrienterochelin and colicin
MVSDTTFDSNEGELMRRQIQGWGGRSLALLALLLLVWGAVIVAVASAQQGATVSGTVRDAATGEALSGVQVTAGRVGAITDREGRFALRLTGEEGTLRFQRIGYTPQEFAISGFAGSVAMRGAPVLLDGIVAEAHEDHHLAMGTALAVGTVDGETVRSRAAPSLAEAMLGMEGFSVSRTGAWGSRPVLRGLGGERLAIMVDGSRVNRACTFGMDQGLATIDPWMVERVEVLTGPGSTLYGSGNLGGVINVVTRRGTSDRPVAGEVRTGASSAVPGGSVGGSLWLRGDRWDAGFALDASSFGNYSTPSGPVAGSGMSQATGDVKLSFAPSLSQRVQIQAQRYEGRDIGWPSMGGGEGMIPEESRSNVALDYGWQRGRGVVDAVTTTVFRQRLDHVMEMTMTMPMDGMGGTMTSRTDATSFSITSGARAQARLMPGASTHLDVGGEVTQWAAEATRWTEQTRMGNTTTTELRTWPNVEIRDFGAFAQGETGVGRGITLSAGARADRITRSADLHETSVEWVGTGNVGARAELGRGFTARSTAGLGYRIPDPTELFGLAIRPDGFLYRGNSDLRTETGRNIEAAIDFASDRFRASGTLFRNDLRDLIAPVATTDTGVGGRAVRVYENIDRARLVGITGSGGLSVTEAVEVGGTLTYTRGTDLRQDEALPALPPLEASASVTVAPGVGVDWLAIEGRAAARQTRVATSRGETETPGYGVLNVRMGFRLAGANLVAGVENVLDHEYRSHLDLGTLNQPGRNFFIRVQRGF